MFEVWPRIGITTPWILLRLPVLDEAAGATAAVPAAVTMRPRGDATGSVGRITAESGGVHNDSVGDRDVGGDQRDPPGSDAHAAAESHLAGEIGRYNAPGLLAGEGGAGEEHEAAVPRDVDVAAQLDLLGDLASRAEVPLPMEVFLAGRHRRHRGRGRRRGRRRRVVVPHQDRVRVRVRPIWRLRAAAPAGAGVPEGRAEEQQEAEIEEGAEMAGHGAGRIRVRAVGGLVAPALGSGRRACSGRRRWRRRRRLSRVGFGASIWV